MAHTHRPSILVLVETWVVSARVAPFLERLGYDGGFFVDPVGFSGGIWVFWQTQALSIQVLCHSRQYIHMRVQPTIGPIWLFTAVYASPRASLRDSLWRDLHSLAGAMVDPWLLVGDFNVIVDSSERRGISISRSLVCKKFIDLIDQCHLLDLGFSGTPFTWARGRVRKRLDRALANAQWRIAFEEAAVLHIPRTKSDHSPLLINLDPSLPSVYAKPFRYQVAWTTHKDFSNLIAGNWETDRPLEEATSRLATTLKAWNKRSFGNVFRRFLLTWIVH
ncbi:hypothetical protein Tsubulata_014296 [Turnera subulata]|uniref:Endonuclease/exonuclease/phosphatase domain-containing protein n=1 Tax=Turnera subulata TaxID=218843 RepID=A0A9Q0EZV0_9ROSI|nr:hypothetical protein Tsubulata_014296 [Turnera subulata]